MNEPNSTTGKAADYYRGEENLRDLLVENVVLKKLNALAKERKAATEATFRPGEKVEITNTQGVKLGSVSMSQPNKKAVCHDDAVLLGMAVENGYELEDFLPTEGTPEYVEAVNVLTEAGRADLLRVSVSTGEASELAQKVLEEWQITGKLPNGWEIEDASSPRFTVTAGRTAPAKAALEHVLKEVQGAFGLTLPDTTQKELEG